MKFDEMVSKSKSTNKSFNTKMLFLAIIGIVGIIVVIFVFKAIFSGKEKVTIVSLDKNGMEVVTKDKSILITELQMPGKKKVNIKDFVNGIKKEDYIEKIFV